MLSKLLLNKGAFASIKSGSAFETIKKFASNDVKEDIDHVECNNIIAHNNDEVLRKQFLKSKFKEFENGWNFIKLSLCSNKESYQFINNKNGNILCSTCNLDESFDNLKKKTSFLNAKEEICKIEKKEKFDFTQNKEISQLKDTVPIKSISSQKFDRLIIEQNLPFKQSTYEHFDIRFNELSSNLLFPIYNLKNEIIDLVSIKDNNSTEQKLPLYGLQLLDKHPRIDRLIISDSILNALSLYESLNIPVLVLNSDIVLPDHFKIHLERFNKIIIWLNDKQVAWKIAEQLNSHRCFLISHSKSPFDCLKSNIQLKSIVSSEQFSLKNDGLVQIKDMLNDVYDEVSNLKKIAGTKWNRFPVLNELLKGFRPGELTIFTGQTGAGKTTFLSEYSVDLCVAGVPTLWGSFEIKNSRLAKMMMTQYSGVNLSKNINFFNEVSKEFSKLPMYFMNFHGEEQLENVIRTMSQAVILHGIKHVVIDNLQFMMGNQRSTTLDKFSLQDLMISSFRKFATNFNCHVTLVIHPRKKNDDELLQISSIFGTAKACQEADNILILQEKRVDLDDSRTWFKYIEICKNRFDGDLGKLFLKFDKDRLSYYYGTKVYKHQQQQSKYNRQHSSIPDEDHMIDAFQNH